MTTTPATRPVRASLRSAHGVTFGGVLRSEWIKLRSLRSTFWCAVIILVLTVGLAPLPLLVLQDDQIPPGADAFMTIVMSSITLASGFTSLVAAVLGALMITSEFGTGMIRSTFAAVPRRIPALVGKAVVLVVTLFVVAAVSVLLAALVVLAVVNGRGRSAHIDAAFWLSLLGDAGYIALIGLLSLAIGAIIRNSAGGIATAVGFILVLPTIANLFAALARVTWAQNVGAFLPSNAGGRLFAYPALEGTSIPGQGGQIILEPWQGLLVLLAWIAVLGAAAIILVRRRDA